MPTPEYLPSHNFGGSLQREFEAISRAFQALEMVPTPQLSFDRTSRGRVPRLILDATQGSVVPVYSSSYTLPLSGDALYGTHLIGEHPLTGGEIYIERPEELKSYCSDQSPPNWIPDRYSDMGIGGNYNWYGPNSRWQIIYDNVIDFDAQVSGAEYGVLKEEIFPAYGTRTTWENYPTETVGSDLLYIVQLDGIGWVDINAAGRHWRAKPKYTNKITTATPSGSFITGDNTYGFMLTEMLVQSDMQITTLESSPAWMAMTGP